MHVYTCIIRFMHDAAKPSAIQGLSQKRSVRAVVFDYGNVLCLEQTLENMKGMALVCGIPHERFSELYWKLRPPYDRGDIDGPAYWTAVVGQQELGLSRDQIATLIKLDSENITRPNQGAVQWAKLLHHEGFRDVTPCRINRTRRALRSPSSRSRTRESTTWWLREPHRTTSAYGARTTAVTAEAITIAGVIGQTGSYPWRRLEFSAVPQLSPPNTARRAGRTQAGIGS